MSDCTSAHSPVSGEKTARRVTPLPAGADAVIMVEHGQRNGDRVRIEKSPKPGDSFSPRGVEARNGERVLTAGRRLGFAEVALLAMVGRECAQVFRKPIVGILPTGDEIVEAGEQPASHQIRNSNAWSLAAQVTVVVPSGNTDPDSVVQVAVTGPSTSSSAVTPV